MTTTRPLDIPSCMVDYQPEMVWAAGVKDLGADSAYHWLGRGKDREAALALKAYGLSTHPHRYADNGEPYEQTVPEALQAAREKGCLGVRVYDAQLKVVEEIRV